VAQEAMAQATRMPARTNTGLPPNSHGASPSSGMTAAIAVTRASWAGVGRAVGSVIWRSISDARSGGIPGHRVDQSHCAIWFQSRGCHQPTARGGARNGGGKLRTSVRPARSRPRPSASNGTGTSPAGISDRAQSPLAKRRIRDDVAANVPGPLRSGFPATGHRTRAPCSSKPKAPPTPRP
jgi:hypothetical protein